MIEVSPTYLEKEIMARLDKDEKVYIQCGCATELINSYTFRKFKSLYRQSDVGIMFTMTGDYCSIDFSLSDFEITGTEIYKGTLFIYVK